MPSIPDCVEYGEWKTGLRNDGFQYAFISLGNKMGMALGTSLLAMVLGMCGYVAADGRILRSWQ
ncbi:MAG: MFS transporter [Enterocloster sp.]